MHIPQSFTTSPNPSPQYVILSSILLSKTDLFTCDSHPPPIHPLLQTLSSPGLVLPLFCFCRLAFSFSYVILKELYKHNRPSQTFYGEYFLVISELKQYEAHPLMMKNKALMQLRKFKNYDKTQCFRSSEP